MSERINPTQTTKIALLIAFGFVLVLLIFSMRGGESPSAQSELLVSPTSDDSVVKAGRTAMVGGLGAKREKDDEVQEVVNQILPEFAAQAGKEYTTAEVIFYRAQTVAGRNFFVKAKVKTNGGEEDIVHLRIYRDLGKKVSLTAFEPDKKLDSELNYFQ